VQARPETPHSFCDATACYLADSAQIATISTVNEKATELRRRGEGMFHVYWRSVSGVKREVQCLLKIGILEKDR